MAYIVDLEKFYGPLELLLYLVEKNEMDIYDIPVAEITRQYMAFLEENGRIDLESLGDFLVMASFLLNLKSRLLLPVRSTPAETLEEEGPGMLADPREELVRMLLEYKRFKLAADHLASRQAGEGVRVFFRESSQLPEAGEELSASVKTLARALKQLLNRDTAEEVFYYQVSDIDVGEKMQDIMSYLSRLKGRGDFQALITQSGSRRESAAFFLALLELVRMNKVEAEQDEAFGGIDICLAGREGWSGS